MNEIKINHRFEWWYLAGDEFKKCMTRLGYSIYGCSVKKGCHWGEFYAFDENYEKIKELVEKQTVIVTNNHRFFVQPFYNCLGERLDERFFFNIIRNK